MEKNVIKKRTRVESGDKLHRRRWYKVLRGKRPTEQATLASSLLGSLSNDATEVLFLV